jgi:hypothetical protein
MLGGVFVLLCGLSGCGSSADSLMKDQINLMNEMADAIEKGEPEAKLQTLKQRGEEIEKKMKAMNISDAEKKRLEEKYKDDLTKALGRLLKAGMEKGGKDLKGLKP